MNAAKFGADRGISDCIPFRSENSMQSCLSGSQYYREAIKPPITARIGLSLCCMRSASTLPASTFSGVCRVRFALSSLILVQLLDEARAANLFD